jgi:regulator of replication initiation timing
MNSEAVREHIAELRADAATDRDCVCPGEIADTMQSLLDDNERLTAENERLKKKCSKIDSHMSSAALAAARYAEMDKRE